MNLINWNRDINLENTIFQREETTYYIYLHTSPNGKKYVGKTKDIKRRWNPDLYKHNKEFFKDIEEYGWDNIKHEVMATTNYDWLARKLEHDLIHRFIDCSYNISNTVYENYKSRYNRKTK